MRDVKPAPCCSDGSDRLAESRINDLRRSPQAVRSIELHLPIPDPYIDQIARSAQPSPLEAARAAMLRSSPKNPHQAPSRTKDAAWHPKRCCQWSVKFY